MKIRNFSDWAIALVVIACSAILFAALALALSGTMLCKPSRTVRVNFHDLTGINMTSQVKYGGAVAGRVLAIRMLTMQERAAAEDPLNAVQATLALDANVPPLPNDIKVTVAADTLLSDKFILLAGGSPEAPALAPDALLQGIAPVTFDKLSREIDGTLEGLRKMLGGSQEETGDIFTGVRNILVNMQSLLTEAQPVLQDAKALASDAKSLISGNKEQIARTIARLDKAACALEELATRSNALIRNNDQNLSTSLADFKITSQNLKVTSTYAKFLTRSLTERPSQLIWGNSKPPVLPSETEILKAAKPVPAN